MRYQEILSFWFEETDPRQWWRKDAEFDALCRDRFLATIRAARAGELFVWRDEPRGRLAEIIVLDQLPRNVFRDTPDAFAGDAIALVLAQEAVRCGADQALTDPEQRAFLYMPYMHSESRLVHEAAVRLFSGEGIERRSLDFELAHKAIIDRFGRYPHRNEILGRVSTPEETRFLAEGGPRF